ncbi:MAG TPA: NAD-glutamate dehydrogenase domain-containing protein [Candidatus Acidoferrales bacterium]|nr:NAD-glutamate dehydrogenase domain-containing protein [Candidatus Acidoferrales bacterium]
MAELSKAIARLMEERERAQPQAAVVDPPKLREVLDEVRTKVTPGERPLADAFVRQLFDKAGAELLADGQVPELAGLALAAFRFLTERSTEEPRVLAFDPDLVHDGWEVPCTVIQTVMRDRPFIVDTVRECLREAGCTLRRFVHPILTVERDARGAVLAIHGAAGAPGRKESFVHVEVERVGDVDAVTSALRQHLADVVAATSEYHAMRAKAEEMAEKLRTRALPTPWNVDADEVAAFIDWLGQKSFVFLGYREYQLAGMGTERTAAVRRGTGLGILRKEARSAFAQPQLLPETLRRRLNEPPLLIVSKTNAESPIHRRAHMDYIGVKEIDRAGAVVGERRFVGLFTSKTYAEESATVPLLRRKLAAILEAEGAVEGSHDYKAIVATFNGIPKVELLAASAAELRMEINAIVAAESATAAGQPAAVGDIRVLQRADALGRGVFVVVMLPRERFSDDLSRRIETRLAQILSATVVLDQHLVLDESAQVRMHFYFATLPAGAGLVPPEELRRQVAGLLRTWDDRLRDELREHFPREAARALGERYAAAFSNQYKAATDVGVAVRDIGCLEALLATRSPQVDIANEADGGAARGSAPRFTTVKLYLAGEELVLSDFLPVLENLGLKVFAEYPLDVSLPDVGNVHLHSFFVQDAVGARLDADAVAPLLKPALLAVHAGHVDNDRLNALTLTAGLEWRQVDLLRTYVNHGVQIGTAPSRAALIAALAGYPRTAQLLWQYFAAKFDPALLAAPRERLAHTLPELEQQFLAGLDAVDSVIDDRILRALFSVVAATVRTSFFRVHGQDGGSEPQALAVKVECARVAHLPKPHPLYEIYVHAPHVEALHLRGAKVARGGIRLSDRPDDFRTEILDLMKTQMVKNAVIVPAGAKGGFVVKRRAGAPPTSGQVTAAYRTFIGTLLDLTDNLVQGRIVPPSGILAYDDADPYLVVAADKGTATFSDVANEIAAQRQFWLGDAFASGGTHGYDHKKEAITARGAWECVRRHFRELGRDADRDVLTVIGVGDMSGDVFGNGLLLSPRFRLLAAFNHQHIFLDPNPDPVRAFAERERLFQLPRSSWSDYKRDVISAGGGVFPRNAKRVALAEAARRMLGLDGEHAAGEEVVRAILRMEADLLWNGGIGTYVKAADETPAGVGDSSNDAVRVNGAELRVLVVAEGGNLGLTQRGRVEYALHGGRINTDAIDNSAGVDMSDHEVNLKIALAAAIEGGQLTFAERDRLLAELTPEVTRRVLAHNRRQARILGLDQMRSQTHLADFRELMVQLESEGLLDRHLDGLPDRETLRNRRGVLPGLTRPELAVLLAHGKLALQQRLLASALPDDPFVEAYLRSYFPDVINARFGQAVRSHRLRREIIAVEMANALIDTMGTTFVVRVSRDTGSDAATVVRAWAVVASVSAAAELWAEIGNADPPLPLPAEARAWAALEAAIERATKWIVETQPADTAAAALSDALATPTRELLGMLPNVLPPNAQQGLAAATDAAANEGMPRALAQRIAALDRLAELFEIAHIARDADVSHGVVAEVYYRVGELVDLDWVRQGLAELSAEDRWERRAVEGLAEGLVYARRQLTRDVLLCRQGGGELAACLQEYTETHHEPLTKLGVLINDIKNAPRATLAALLVVMRELGRLVGKA